MRVDEQCGQYLLVRRYADIARHVIGWHGIEHKKRGFKTRVDFVAGDIHMALPRAPR